MHDQNFVSWHKGAGHSLLVLTISPAEFANIAGGNGTGKSQRKEQRSSNLVTRLINGCAA